MGVKDITIRLGGKSEELVSAFKTAESAAGTFKGKMDDFAKQYRSTMAAAFDKSAADRMAQNLFGKLDQVKARMLQQAKEMQGIFSDVSIVKAQGKFSNMGATDTLTRKGTAQSVNLAAATGMDIDKVSNMLAKSLGGNIRELQKLIPEVANLTKEELKAGAAIDLVAQKYEGFGNAANAALKKAELANRMKEMGDKMTEYGKSLSLYVTAPLVAAGGASIKYASDLNESLNKVDVAFGNSSSAVKSFADTSLQKFGVGRGAALDMSATFGDMATSMGLSTGQAAKMATTLTGLAGDLTSFKNIGIDISQTALQSIFTGETESLKKLGVVMTEANLNAYALSKGITTKVQAMSESEKVLLRYNYVLDKTKNSQGDFLRTSQGAANQQRTFTEGIQQLAESFGQVLIPAWERFLVLVNKTVAWLDGLSATTKIITVTVAGLAAAIGPLLVAIGFFTSTILPQLIAGGAAMSAAWAPVTAVVLALAGAFAVFTIASKNAQEQVQAMAGESVEMLNKKLDENNKKIQALKATAPKQSYNRGGTSTGFAATVGAKAMGYVFGDKNSFSDSGYQIKKLEQENAKIREALALKDKQIKQEEDAKAKAKESADASNASLEAQSAKQKKLTGLIEIQEQKVSDLGDAWKKARTPEEITRIAKQLESANKELERLKNLGKEFSKEMSAINNVKIASPFGSDAKKLKPTKDAKEQWNGNAASGIGKYVLDADMFKQTAYRIKALKEMVDSFNQGVVSAITNTIEGIGNMFGHLAAGNGKTALKSFISGFANMIGDFAIQMGVQLIAVGIGIETFKASLKSLNGYAALAAGAALIVAGAAFKAFVNGGVGGGGSRSSSYSAVGRSTPSGSAASAKSSATVTVVGELKMAMGEVKAMLKTVDTQNKYIGV